MFFGGSSKSKQSTTSVNDQGQLVGKSAKVAQGQSNLTDIGKGGTLATGNTITFGAIAKGATVNLTTTSPELLGHLSDLAENTSANFSQVIDSINTASAAGAASQKGLLDGVFEKLTDLAESKQTDGASGQNKTVLYVVIAIVVAVVVYFFGKK